MAKFLRIYLYRALNNILGLVLLIPAIYLVIFLIMKIWFAPFDFPQYYSVYFLYISIVLGIVIFSYDTYRLIKLDLINENRALLEIQKKHRKEQQLIKKEKNRNSAKKRAITKSLNKYGYIDELNWDYDEKIQFISKFGIEPRMFKVHELDTKNLKDDIHKNASLNEIDRYAKDFNELIDILKTILKWIKKNASKELIDLSSNYGKNLPIEVNPKLANKSINLLNLKTLFSSIHLIKDNSNMEISDETKIVINDIAKNCDEFNNYKKFASEGVMITINLNGSIVFEEKK